MGLAACARLQSANWSFSLQPADIISPRWSVVDTFALDPVELSAGMYNCSSSNGMIT